MTIRILLDHGVQEDHIIFLTFLVARIGGIDVVRRAFPKVRIITGAVDDEVKEIWRVEGDGGRKDWQIVPGMGDIGALASVITFAMTTKANIFLQRVAIFRGTCLHKLAPNGNSVDPLM